MIRTKSKINESLNPNDIYVIVYESGKAEMYSGKELQNILNDPCWENGEADPDDLILWNQMSAVKNYGKAEEIDNGAIVVKFRN